VNDQQKILRLLSEKKHVDTIIEESGLTPGTVAGELTLLELHGLAKRLPGNYYVKGEKCR
jgi:predicted Rossmann fold nucleotide-binding protein DprA/Smf involved in DNA uptake